MRGKRLWRWARPILGLTLSFLYTLVLIFGFCEFLELLIPVSPLIITLTIFVGTATFVVVFVYYARISVQAFRQGLSEGKEEANR